MKVECVVSAWGQWSTTPDESGHVVRYRVITTYPLNGAEPCPHLEEYKTGMAVDVAMETTENMMR